MSYLTGAFLKTIWHILKEVTTKFINKRSASDWNSIISSALFENELAFFYIFYALLMETNVNRLQYKYTNIIYRKYSY